MLYISDEELLKMIYEDAGAVDLTAEYLSLDGTVLGEVNFFTREDVVCAGVKTAGRMCELMGANIVFEAKESLHVKAGETLLRVQGKGVELLRVYKVAQSVLEYSCAVATCTSKMVNIARKVCPDVEIVTTRKHIVGAKKISLNAVISGGGLPHRLGLYDSILIFPQYTVFKDDMALVHKHYKEKKVSIEAESLEQALEYVKNVDIIQFDKLTPEALKEAIKVLKKANPNVLIAVAGGINMNNIETYAKTQPDIIVTSAPYFVKPADVGAKMSRV